MGKPKRPSATAQPGQCIKQIGMLHSPWAQHQVLNSEVHEIYAHT